MNRLFDLTNRIIAWFKYKSTVIFGNRPEDFCPSNPEMTSLFSVDHDMFDDGTVLKEEMEISEKTDKDGKRFIVHIHRRSIADKSGKTNKSYNFYKTIDTNDEPSIAIAPIMSEQEIREFNSEWKDKCRKANSKK